MFTLQEIGPAKLSGASATRFGSWSGLGRAASHVPPFIPPSRTWFHFLEGGSAPFRHEDECRRIIGQNFR